ncbi:transmembrane protein with metallophosphoesterase domain-like [Actinia tenebrosa]|uniref:Transmembrane protein with metallophosphoesterase domain-like n=1 Tax=Actinia tenebrosa TaxID=6105 RepID=A0A6P8I987_ACTTE|nr:transmembrane protein with metallophosphoesterase domain-like [Actinia tenebrosa]
MAASMDKALVVVGIVVSLNLVSFIGTYFSSFNEKLKYRLLIVQLYLMVQSVLFFIARYVWIRVCPTLFRSTSSLERVLMMIVAAILVLGQFSWFSGVILAGEEPHLFTLITYTCLGITLLMASTIFLVDLLWWILSCLRVPIASHLHRSSKTRFKILLILAISASLTLYGLQNASRSPTINRLSIPIKNLPMEFKGFTILQLSDLHVGITVGKTKLEEIVKTCNELKPDVIVVTGDLVDATVYQIRQAVKPLLRLKAKYGLYYVTGNHEYYTGDVDAWIKELEFLGVHVLHNSHITIQHPKNPTAMLCIAGVDDYDGGIFRYGEHGVQLDKALAGLKPHTATILLAHQPKVAKKALQAYPNIGLVLCGHTHSGQIIPIHLYHYILQPYFSGLHRHERGSYVYVNTGTFFWGMPMRVFSSSEIAYISLIPT